jgi:hypothetical protein
MPVIQDFGDLRLEDREFQGSLEYIELLRPAWATIVKTCLH